MIQKGNSKIGQKVWTFSLPAVETCPGMTATCRKSCYARSGHFTRPAVQRTHRQNAAGRLLPGWVEAMVFEILRGRPELFRVHVSGDFDSVRYVRQWIKIVKSCLATEFYTYTRSWRVKSMLPALTRLAGLDNFYLILSCDQDTGEPPNMPRTKKAYLSTGPDDWPPYRVDLIFRTNRRTPMKYAPTGNLVCPPENGTGLELTCDKCKLCFSNRPVPSRPPTSTTRVPLPLAV